MKAWIITAPGTLEQVDLPSEEIGSKEVKIKVGHGLISRPDVQTYLGSDKAKLPIVPGGSCSGMVVGVGSEVTDVSRGDRVFVHPQKMCGDCTDCREGKGTCANVEYYGITRNGFMRDFAVVSERDCIKIPDRVPGKETVFLDYIALAVSTIEALRIKKGEHLVISGASTLGIILGQVALYYQAVPILVDSNDDYLAMAAETGIFYTANTTKNAYDKIFHITGGKMVECVAHIATGGIDVRQSIDLAGRGGRVAIVGRYGAEYSLECSLLPVIERNIGIIGVSHGIGSTRIAINMLANKAINVDKLINREVGFDAVPEVLESNARSREHLKTVISFG